MVEKKISKETPKSKLKVNKQIISKQISKSEVKN